MSRRIAHRPHHHAARVTPRPLPRSQQEYLRQRWIYRQRPISYLKRPLGYSLSLVPWGWKLAFPEIKRRA